MADDSLSVSHRPSLGKEPFTGRSTLLGFTDQLVELGGGTRVAPRETRPVVVVEGIGGSGRSALLATVCARWAGRTPAVLVSPLALPSQHENSVRPVLAAVMLGLSSAVPGFKVTFSRVLLAEIAMADPIVSDDPVLAVGEMLERLRRYREPRALLELIRQFIQTAARLGTRANSPVVDAIAPELPDRLAEMILERVRGTRWLAKVAWQEALEWFDRSSQPGNGDPVRGLVALNRRARSQAPAVRDEINDQLVGALLADLRYSIARARGRPTNALVLLDDGDVPSASVFTSSLLRVRQAEAAVAELDGIPPDPLVLVTTSGGLLAQYLAVNVADSSYEHESGLLEDARPRLNRATPVVRVSSAGLLAQDVLTLTREFDWPLELAPAVIGDAVHRLTDGHPEATALLLRSLARAPDLIDDLDAVLRGPGPDRLPVEEYLLRRIVTALSPHRRFSAPLLGTLVTVSAARDRLEAQSLSSLVKTSRGDRGRLLDSPVLWSAPGPGAEPGLHPFIRYLCLRALVGRGKNHPASWHRVFTRLRGGAAPDDVAARLHHDLGLAETQGESETVVSELAALLPRMSAEAWLDLLDTVVSTPNPGRAGRAARLLRDDAIERGSLASSVARLLEVRHLLSDRCLSDRGTLSGLYLLAAHDCEQLADSSRNAVVLIRRAAGYRQRAASLS